MKIAVTGANGYIGAHLVKKCLDFGHSVVAVDLANEYINKRAEYINADIFNDENLYQKFGSPDVLIHLAWKNGFIHNAPSHLEDLLGLIQEQPKALWTQLCLFKQFKNDRVLLFLHRRKLLIMKNGSAKKIVTFSGFVWQVSLRSTFKNGG